MNWWHLLISMMTWFHAACWNLPHPSHSFFPSLFSHLPLSLSSPSLLLSLCVFLQRPPAFERHTVLTYWPFQPYAHEEREPQVNLYCAALRFHLIDNSSLLVLLLAGVIFCDQGLVLQKRRQEYHCMKDKNKSASWIIYCFQKLEICLLCYYLI